MRIATSDCFARPLRRRFSAGVLAAAYLILSSAAGFHSGSHDTLDWLPTRFHHHDYRWADEPSGAPLPLVDHCLACNIGRTIVCFVPPGLLLPDAPDVLIVSVAASADAAPSRADFPHTPRAPPAS
jgi:hypothetical protein